MTQWLAGMRITADRLNDFTPVALSTTVTPATNFTVTAFTAYEAAGITVWQVTLTYTGSTLTGSSAGNITDTACCTLPSNCWPQGTMVAEYETSNGATGASGAVKISSAGVCTLLTLMPTATISSTSIVAFSGAFATG